MNRPHTKLPTPRMRVKKLLREIVTLASYFSGLSHVWYWLFARKAVRILAYHGIQTQPSNSYAVSTDNFKKQMQYLKNNYNVISLNDYQKLIELNHSILPNTVIITFDDGFMNFFKNAYPILKKYSLPATCFIITSKMENSNEDFMTWNDVQRISSDRLVSIGSHSVSHKSLSDLDSKTLESEIRESKKILEKILGKSIRLFSFPYGTPRDFNQNCISTLSTSGYILACTAVNGVNSKRTNPYKLRRTKIEWGDDLSIFRKILRGTIDFWVFVDYFFNFLQNNREVNFDLQSKRLIQITQPPQKN